MSALTRVLGAAALAGATALVAACGGDNNTASTSPAAVISGPSTSLFEGQLAVGGSAFYSFTVSSTGEADVMLASITSSTKPGSSLNVPLGLGLGTPLGTDCTVTTSLVTFPALQSPLVSNLSPGVYCIRVYDVGGLPTNVNFAIRIVHT